jgi:hypothetical protein
VPDLVVEEMARQRVRQLMARYGKLTEAAKALGPYVTLGAVGALDEPALLDRLLGETRAALTKIPVSVIPVSAVGSGEVLALSIRRVPPFKKIVNPTGFHDAVILLASLNYARSAGLGYGVFVSADTDHDESAIDRLARNRGLECWLKGSTDEVTETRSRPGVPKPETRRLHHD